MAATLQTRSIFIQSAMDLLKAHKFDGLDLSWSYPTQNGGAPEDRVSRTHTINTNKLLSVSKENSPIHHSLTRV